mmetsp:Transcript_4228/g.9876  ORF Transcript_4228/g.9876 Transcript_4228/m.9876 type:complete len:221 (+) Transcript_4228:2229-2891(+)
MLQSILRATSARADRPVQDRECPSGVLHSQAADQGGVAECQAGGGGAGAGRRQGPTARGGGGGGPVVFRYGAYAASWSWDRRCGAGLGQESVEGDPPAGQREGRPSRGQGQARPQAHHRCEAEAVCRQREGYGRSPGDPRAGAGWRRGGSGAHRDQARRYPGGAACGAGSGCNEGGVGVSGRGGSRCVGAFCCKNQAVCAGPEGRFGEDVHPNRGRQGWP